MKEQMLPIQGPNPKINEYVERIKNGADKDYTLQGLPQSWITAVESKLAAEKNEKIPVEKPDSIGSVDSPQKEIVPEISIGQKQEKIEDYKKLSGWPASYELAKIAKQEGVDLSNLSREEYVEYAVKNHLAIDDSQLRAHPSQRNGTSVDEVRQMAKQEQAKINEDSEKNFARFSYEMMQLAQKPQQERFLSKDVRVLSGTKDSNSWLFFSINNGTNQQETDTFKSYFAMKDLNTLTPDRFKGFMKYLQEGGYNGGVKIFQDMAEQGTRLNDQVVMHGFSEQDSKLALQLAEQYFIGELASKSLGKDEIIEGKSQSYSQILAEQIRARVLGLKGDEAIEKAEQKSIEKAKKEQERLDKIEELRTLLGANQKTMETGIDEKQTGVEINGGQVNQNSNAEVSSLEDIEKDLGFQKIYQQMVVEQFKKDFPYDFDKLYEPELNEELELVPKNKNNIPELASRSITNFKNTDVFELKEKALERYKAIKEPYVEKDIAQQVEEIYHKSFGIAGIKNETEVSRLDALAQKMLFHDPEFKKFYESSHRVFKNDEATANMDALGTYLSRRGYQIAGY